MMIRLFVVLIVALAGTGRAAAQRCRADFDASGAVEVNEVIQVVNEALGGCGVGSTATPTRRAATPTRTPTPAPASCPFRFNDAVDSNEFCGYEGDADSACSVPFAVVSSWVTDGGDVIAVLVSAVDSIGVLARRTSPTAASISGFALGPDFTDFFTTSGTLSLPSGRQFRMAMQASADCGTLSHTGDFAGLFGDSAQVGTASGSAGLSGAMHGEPAGAALDHRVVATWRALSRGMSLAPLVGRQAP